MSFTKASAALQKSVNKIFGVTCVYNYLAGGTTTFKAVFDNEFVQIQDVSSLKPILKIRLADLTATPVELDTVTVNTILYTVRDSQNDAHGNAVLILEKN